MKILIGRGIYQMPIHIKLGRLTVKDIEKIPEPVAAIGRWLDQEEPAELGALRRRIIKPAAERLCRSLREDLFQNRPDIVSQGQIQNDKLFQKIALLTGGRGADLITDRRLDPASLLAFQLRVFRARQDPTDFDYFHLITSPSYEEEFGPGSGFSPWLDCEDPVTNRFYGALTPDEQIQFITDLGSCGWVFALAGLHRAIIAAGPAATDAAVQVLRGHGYSQMADEFAEIARNTGASG